MRALSRIFRRRRPDELAAIEAEITAFGEELARHALVPARHGADAALLADYERALDAYERAKAAFAGDRDRRDAEDVLAALDDGRHALAGVDARMDGRPPPPRLPACFFDARHGPSATRVGWTPPGGARRIIDVCAADAVRLAEGMPPIATRRRRDAAPPRPRRPEPPPPPRRRAPAPPGERAPRRPGAPGAPSEPAPFKTWPPGLPKDQRVQGRDDGTVLLRRPDADRPLLLVVRVHHPGPARVDLEGRGRPYLLHRGRVPDRVVLPMPADEAEHVRLLIESRSTWTAWLQAADTAPIIQERLASRGSFVFRHAGGPGRISMRHEGRGPFSLTELTLGFDQGERILSGLGDSAAQGQLAGPTFVHVRADGPWTVALL